MKNKNENEITTIELASTKKRKHSLKKSLSIKFIFINN